MVASTIYGSLAYLAELRASGREPRWLGVECDVFHRTWTKHSRCDLDHRVFVGDTMLTQAVLR